jgi:hypothetical protein
LKSSWEREKYIDNCTFEERKGIGWWHLEAEGDEGKH